MERLTGMLRAEGQIEIMEGALCGKTGVIDETPRAENGMLGEKASVGRPKGKNERGGWGSTESRMGLWWKRLCGKT